MAKNKVMRLLDAHRGLMECRICGAYHQARRAVRAWLLAVRERVQAARGPSPGAFAIQSVAPRDRQELEMSSMIKNEKRKHGTNWSLKLDLVGVGFFDPSNPSKPILRPARPILRRAAEQAGDC